MEPICRMLFDSLKSYKKGERKNKTPSYLNVDTLPIQTAPRILL
jgi:hypothetical protein